MSAPLPVFPERFVALKKEIIPAPSQELLTAWNDILAQLAVATKAINAAGPDGIPQIDFEDIGSLSAEQVAEIKRKGTVVIRNVVEDELALEWKRMLREYIEANPQVEGFPKDNKQFFEI